MHTCSCFDHLTLAVPIIIDPKFTRFSCHAFNCQLLTNLTGGSVDECQHLGLTILRSQAWLSQVKILNPCKQPTGCHLPAGFLILLCYNYLNLLLFTFTFMLYLNLIFRFYLSYSMSSLCTLYYFFPCLSLHANGTIV